MKVSAPRLLHSRRVRQLPLAAGFAALLMAFISPAVADPPLAAPLPAMQWKAVDGKPYALLPDAASKASVYLFWASGCPVCQVYTPRVAELAATYGPQHVRFFLVGASPVDSTATLASFAKTRGLRFPVLQDRSQALVRWLSADTTPQAVVVDSAGIVRYRGRIDDNRNRTLVIRHDLKDALDAILAGQPVPRPRTLCFGCRIFLDQPAVASAPAALHPLTYVHDVAPILNHACVSCHRTGESGPFSLETYAGAKVWALPIKDYTARHVMPPWKAAPGYGDFKDARTLSDQEITTLARWVDQGARQGDPKLTPPLPRFPPKTLWSLGKPDLVLSASRPYRVPAEGQDIYRQFVLPTDWDTDRYLSSVELHPDNRAVVHHVILYLDPRAASTDLEGKDGQPGYTVPGVGIFPPGKRAPSEFMVGWAAGNTPAGFPRGTAMKVPAHARLVLQVHYHMDGRPEIDRTSVGIHFADPATVQREMRVGAIVNAGFVLHPGESNQELHAGMTVPADLHVWSVSPHMHMLGRQMKITATLPDGQTLPLVWVKDWDFNWQENYRYQQPLAIPRGTRVDLLAVFDNSEQNPRQTSHPPREVRWGEQTSDEMCIGFFTYTVDMEHLHLSPASTSPAGPAANSTASAPHPVVPPEGTL